MSPRRVTASICAGRFPRLKDRTLGRKPSVILPGADFDRRIMKATGPLDGAADVRSGSARRTNVAAETVSPIENGHRNPTARTVRSILKAPERAG